MLTPGLTPAHLPQRFLGNGRQAIAFYVSDSTSWKKMKTVGIEHFWDRRCSGPELGMQDLVPRESAAGPPAAVAFPVPGGCIHLFTAFPQAVCALGHRGRGGHFVDRLLFFFSFISPALVK